MSAFQVFIGLLLLWNVYCERDHVTITRATVSLDDSVTLTVNPTLLTEYESQTVKVQWSGVANPSSDDWIGVFSPVPSTFLLITPVKYQFCNASSEYQATGSGAFSFNLLNMHAEYVFVLFRNGTQYPIVLAVSEQVTFQNLNEPLQGHLTLTSTLSEMKLSWAIGYESISQYVEWGTRSGNYTNSEYATLSTYTVADMCGPPASTVGWRDPGYLATALMVNLQPNQTYYYRYGSDQSGWSPEYTFISPPKVAKDTGVRIIAFGDMGQGQTDDTLEPSEQQPSLDTTSNIAKIIESSHVDFVLHVGDLSYANGYSAEWDQFMSQILPVATRVAYMTSGGNHEIDYPNATSYYNGTDSGGECGVPYNARFTMPGVSVQEGVHWYSFNYGNVHVLMMDTEYNFQAGSAQYDFIENDLKNVNRQNTPWVIFCGHRPMYIDSDWFFGYNSDQSVAELLREVIEPLLVKYNVNLGLWGHHHSYQRTCPVYNQTCSPESTEQPPVHVVIGMAGKDLSQNVLSTAPVWLDFIDDMEWGYTIIETTQKTLTLTFYNNNNQIRDKFELYQ